MKAKIGEYHRVTGDIFSMSKKEILQNRWQSVADKLLQVCKTEDPEDLTEFAIASLFLQDIANIKKEFKQAAEISEETINLYLKSFLKNYPESCHKLLTDEFLYILSPFHYKVRWNKEQNLKKGAGLLNILNSQQVSVLLCLKPYFPESEHNFLENLLQGIDIERRLTFINGSPTQFPDFWRRVMEAGHISQPNKVIQNWILKYFTCRCV